MREREIFSYLCVGRQGRSLCLRSVSLRRERELSLIMSFQITPCHSRHFLLSRLIPLFQLYYLLPHSLRLFLSLSRDERESFVGEREMIFLGFEGGDELLETCGFGLVAALIGLQLVRERERDRERERGRENTR